MAPSFTKIELTELYSKQKMSVAEIARQYKCSEKKIDYWIKKFNIPKRSISEAIYIKQNPTGDPFKFKKPTTSEEWFLFGLGIGLYWGEGTKKNTTAVRLGNTDPHLIKYFLRFLKEVYNIEERKIRFGLQIFSDMDATKAVNFWCKFLDTKKEKFMKPVITPARGVGNYREKTKFGVLTVYVSNKKLRDLIYNEIESLR